MEQIRKQDILAEKESKAKLRQANMRHPDLEEIIDDEIRIRRMQDSTQQFNQQH